MRLSILLAAFVASAACAQPPPGQVESVVAQDGPVAAYEVAMGLEAPWGLTFLPDGRMLVTEKGGALRVVEGNDVSPPVEGTPTVYAQGQGGLLDVALDPDFEAEPWVYLTYAKPGPEGQAATAVGRARWAEGDRLEGWEELWVQRPYHPGGGHFGSRIAFLPDGTMAVTTGERFLFDPAQDLGTTLGKVVRLNRDGSVPDDNPFVGRDGALPEIWSYGHRNVQAAGVDPQTGELYVVEMGPLGGDELNRVEAGANYGWPVVSWGRNYDGSEIPDPPTRPEFADALVQWTPVISPNGLVFYSGDVFPVWRGDAIVGSLSQQGIARVRIEGGAVTEREVLTFGRRIRDVEQGPDGYLYLLTDGDDGQVWRLEPVEAE